MDYPFTLELRREWRFGLGGTWPAWLRTSDDYLVPLLTIFRTVWIKFPTVQISFRAARFVNNRSLSLVFVNARVHASYELLQPLICEKSSSCNNVLEVQSESITSPTTFTVTRLLQLNTFFLGKVPYLVLKTAGCSGGICFWMSEAWRNFCQLVAVMRHETWGTITWAAILERSSVDIL